MIIIYIWLARRSFYSLIFLSLIQNYSKLVPTNRRTQSKNCKSKTKSSPILFTKLTQWRGLLIMGLLPSKIFNNKTTISTLSRYDFKIDKILKSPKKPISLLSYFFWNPKRVRSWINWPCYYHPFYIVSKIPRKWTLKKFLIFFFKICTMCSQASQSLIRLNFVGGRKSVSSWFIVVWGAEICSHPSHCGRNFQGLSKKYQVLYHKGKLEYCFPLLKFWITFYITLNWQCTLIGLAISVLNWNCSKPIPVCWSF